MDTIQERNLTLEEMAQATLLMQMIPWNQVRGSLWHAIVNIQPSVPLELLVLNARNEVLLTWRDDFEYKGWHHPGSCLGHGETIPQRRLALVEREIKKVGIQISDPECIGFLEGGGPYYPDGRKSRHGVGLIHIAKLVGEWIPTETVKFFPIDAVPEETLVEHKYIIGRVRKYLGDLAEVRNFLNSIKQGKIPGNFAEICSLLEKGIFLRD